ncbi:MAG: 6,7-dimethyl-8-ribityllumazine synthase [Parcubacteria group bacterium GW2011_GWA2_47_8]|nr:MAG: 6,7-dimethyl-8-ribityllumazine synthase [Parcubacteria group bacterium GW2011_GWA2_47_8]OHB18756.1 MAG: riboflavin synthase subunit alpha [Parcubacteria group bacterium RIFCSPHIGHO2_01_FULL_47_10b]
MTPNIALILGSFHKKRVERMLKKARRVAKELGLHIAQEVWVPGSMEKPLALKRVLASPHIAGAVVLGIIERGETKHGLVMAQSVIPLILQLQLDFMKPVGVGILGPEILDKQIDERLEAYAEKAVRAVKEMLELLE